MSESRKLGSLLSRAGVRTRYNFRDVVVRGLTDDSRRVGPGSLFIAVRGENADGHLFVFQAVERGAVAVVVEDEAFPGREAIGNVPLVVVEDGRAAAARIAAAYYGHPSDKLKVVGITGTNGKTTTSILLRSIFEAGGTPVGLLGTNGYVLGGEVLPAPTTTPGPIELQKLLARMVERGLYGAVMEVSSHALMQHRVLGVDFDAAAFTNLRSDHMDYHGTPDEYLKAKGKLFSLIRPEGWAVLNADDWASMVYASDASGKVLFYSRKDRADLRAEICKGGTRGSEILFHWKGRTLPLTLSLPGHHNVENAAAAATTALALGLPAEAVVKGLAAVSRVPGRLEPVSAGQPFELFVDYAHTDDALRAVLENLRDRVRGRILLVFGCGGDRDALKRPRMGRVAEALADFAVVTSDNPRTEEPMAIIRDIVSGFGDRKKYIINPDRQTAIETAVRMARPGDVVLIAGKGHETTQDCGGRKTPFDDREAARVALAGRIRPGTESLVEGLRWLDRLAPPEGNVSEGEDSERLRAG
jgi:UDP-N-acetylmuramoyl-L-alanyl-D-glutamate--2,6-diaminopimelate ligase